LEKTLSTLIFLLIYVAGFLSISGFGKLILIKNNFGSRENFFEFGIYGFLLLLILSYFIQFILGGSYLVNILIFVTGLALYFLFKSKKNKIKTHFIFLFLLVFFVGLLISKTHEDFNFYHYFSIKELFENNLRIGVDNLNTRFFYSSLFIYNQILYVIPFLNFKLVHIPIFYLYICSIGYFLFNIYKIKNNDQNLYSIFCILILIVKFTRLSEFGYDYAAQFLLLIVFHKIFFFSDNMEEFKKAILIFILSVLLRPISLFFFPIFLYLIKNRNIIKINKLGILWISILSAAIIIILSSSFLRTGCIFYPITNTCFDEKKVFWSQKNYIEDHSNEIKNWAKGFYHQENTKFTKINDPKLFSSKFNWFKYWIELHFFYKIFEFLIILVLSFLITYIYFQKEKLSSNQKLFSRNLYFLFLSLISLIFWLSTLPQFRFGFGIIMIVIYLFLKLIFKRSIIFNIKKFNILLIIILIFFNLKNFNRINSEISRNDLYRFDNFPYYTEQKIEIDKKNITINKFLIFEIINKSE
jgi:hypothetical protein